MKTDKLEQFIIDQRDEFDDLEPNPAIWDRIGKKEPKVISINWTKTLVRVAAVFVIFVSSYIFFDYVTTQHSGMQLAENETEDTESTEMYQELVEAEYYYSSQIEQKKEEFYYLAKNDSPLRNEVTMELTELDKVFQELKNDLKDNADNEEVVVAMIQNYRLKLEILEEIMGQLESAKDNTKDNENESVNL